MVVCYECRSPEEIKLESGFKGEIFRDLLFKIGDFLKISSFGVRLLLVHRRRYLESGVLLFVFRVILSLPF